MARIRMLYQLIAANGLLWVGAILGLPLLRTSRSFQLGSMWLLLAVVPVAMAMIVVPATETRMYTTIAPPLFLLSTLGWTRFSTEVSQGSSHMKAAVIAGVCLILILISQPVSYAFLRTLPGGWRLYFVRQYLAPMPFERTDFHVPELARVYKAIAAEHHSPVIVASPAMQGADHIMVLEYLAPFDRDDPNAGAAGDAGHRLAASSHLEVHMAKLHDEDVRFIASVPRDQSVWLLRRNDEEIWENGFNCCGHSRSILVTEHYTLSEFVRDAPGR